MLAQDGLIPPDLRSTISVAVGVSIPLELVSSRSSSPSKAEYVSSPARFEDGLRIFEQPGSSEGEHAEMDGLITIAMHLQKANFGGRRRWWIHTCRQPMIENQLK